MDVRAIAALTATLAVGAVAVAPAATSPTPVLRLADRDPLILRGEGFRPRERVRVIVYAPLVARRATRATAAGSFRVTVAEIAAHRCDAIRAVAQGSDHSRAVLKVLPGPACMPARVGR